MDTSFGIVFFSAGAWIKRNTCKEVPMNAPKPDPMRLGGRGLVMFGGMYVMDGGSRVPSCIRPGSLKLEAGWWERCRAWGKQDWERDENNKN